MYKYLKENGWKIRHTTTIPGQKGEYFNFDDLNLSDRSIKYIKQVAPNGIYRHQKEAIKRFMNSQNVCLTTKTDSGKSLAFYVAAIEQLVKDKDSKIIAIYPLKALAREQEKHWKEAFEKSGITAKVKRIDGQVRGNDLRIKYIKDSNVLIMTPDIIHAWLLKNTNNRAVVNFISQIKLIIADEIHNYTGVFGSNSAFLFRRLQHLMNLLNTSPQYITASATIKSTEEHLHNLFGLDFYLIDSKYDSSPVHKLKITFVEPPRTEDVFSYVPDLLKYISQNTYHKFLTFVDSRKQTEYITSIISRRSKKEQKENYDAENLLFNKTHLDKLNILPFRSGYELEDRNRIQDRLNKGELKGVVSTSALELGINIPHLTLGILLGVPRSMTSFYQRIGRIGRMKDGEILIINTGDIFSETIFNNPKKLFQLPLSEGAMYLENKRIQYIHALCLARNGGEHDNILSFLGRETSSDFESPINWPKGFISLCKSERIGVIPPELQNMKEIAGDNPNIILPLRDVDAQFKVIFKNMGYESSVGYLSHSQLMREAYPGAVYYYTTKPYRVLHVSNLKHTVQVKKEKKYTTKPILLPLLVYPNLVNDYATIHKKYGDLSCIECNLQIGERVKGYEEQRGSTTIRATYPLEWKESKIDFPSSTFERHYFTSGILLYHPSLNNDNVKCNDIANILFEAFLMAVPFESRDIQFACDKFRLKNRFINKGDRFIAIFDQTYGSLRLSSRFADTKILRQAFETSLELTKNENISIDNPTLSALEELYQSVLEPPIDLDLMMSDSEKKKASPNSIKVISPGSRGLFLKENKIYKVEGVFYNKEYDCLTYRGKCPNDSDKTIIRIVPVKDVVEIDGITRFSYYNPKLGMIE